MLLSTIIGTPSLSSQDVADQDIPSQNVSRPNIWGQEHFVAKSAQTERVQPSSLDTCQARILPYERLRTLPNPIRSLQLKGNNGGQLHYFGVEHTNDPRHPQFETLEQKFDALQPTLVFYEGPGRSLHLQRDAAIQRAGDPGLIRYLAHEHGISAQSLEPSRQAEIDAMLERFTPEQVKLFYVLRQVAELRDRWSYSSAQDLQDAVTPILNRFSTFDGLKTVITDIRELETQYQRHWQTPNEWWQVPSRWFHPVLTGAETGGDFTNELHRRASTFRNRHMVDVLTDAVNAGHRVMAVVGHSHIPLQAPALRCTIQSNNAPTS